MIYLSNVTWIHDLAEQRTSKGKKEYDDRWQYDDSMGKERVNDNQDTDYESREIDLYVIGPIFTHKNTKGSMEQW